MKSMIEIREAADGEILGASIFQRRYGQNPPKLLHHVMAFHRVSPFAEVPVCYVHFTPAGKILFGGGACVDDRMIRRMPLTVRNLIRVNGGLYQMTLTWALRHFAPTYSAIFGYCGDALAERIDLAVGFQRTSHAHLLVYWLRDLPADECERLIAQAHAIGPF